MLATIVLFKSFLKGGLYCLLKTSHAEILMAPFQDGVLVTGSTGFIGRALCAELAKRNLNFRPVIRTLPETTLASPSSSDAYSVSDISGSTSWNQAFDNISTVVHLAARVHVMDRYTKSDSDLYNKLNVDGTRRLAEQAAAAGVKRFVYLSTAKVHGDSTAYSPDGRLCSISEDSPFVAVEPYAKSKCQAEAALRLIEKQSELEVVILRPTLVYGPGVRANFFNLVRLADSGLPLPLQSVKNMRSIVYIGNLVDAILRACSMPQAAGENFLVADKDPISTPHLIELIAASLGRQPRLFPCPTPVLNWVGRLIQRSQQISRLTESSVASTKHIEERLQWVHPFTSEQGIAMTCDWYREQPGARRDTSVTPYGIGMKSKW